MPDVDLYRVNKPLARSGISFEVLLVIAGQLELGSFSRNVLLTAGDVVLLQPATVFRFVPVDEPLILSVRIEPQLVGAHLNNLTMRVCRAGEPSNADLQALLAQIACLHDEDSTAASFKIGALVYQMLDLLMQLPEEISAPPVNTVTTDSGDEDVSEPETEAEGDVVEDGRYAQRLHMLRAYINKNYRQPVTLSEVAAYLDLTPQYLSRFTKKHLGQNFIDYLNDVRLDSAINALSYSDETIAKIAFNSGFPNLSAFSTLFRDKYQASPQQYRHIFKAQAGPGGVMPDNAGRRSRNVPEQAGPDLTTVDFDEVRDLLAALRDVSCADVAKRDLSAKAKPAVSDSSEHAFSRTEMLIGPQALKHLQASRVAVFGIGGVGSFVAEGLARAGIGHFVLIDNDVVSISNLNRQLVALHSTIGRPKVEVMRERILDINPAARVEIRQVFVQAENADSMISPDMSYIVDAIDTVSAKIELAVQAQAAGVPIISCMGAGNKFDPTRFEVVDVYKTNYCPLSKVMRRELKKRGIEHLKVVYSPESPQSVEPVESGHKRHVPGSISFVPSVAGLIICGEVVMDLIKSADTF